MSQDSKKKTSFRDTLGIVSSEGKRIWIYAKIPKGKFYAYRLLLGYTILLFFFISPYIKVSGEQILLLDVLHRKFIFFGSIFTPQDFYVFYIVMLGFMVFIVLATVVYGRIWCGWACPQTLFMELLFRNVERIIEGSATKRKKIDKQRLSFEKIIRKSLKHIAFFGLSIFISFTVLMYLKGSDFMFDALNKEFSENRSLFIAMFVFGSIVFLFYSQIRELACTIMCPYGRLQGALLDPNSMIVSYDYKRGEPKAPYIKDENRVLEKKGQCTDCKACVQVCPTGIDIRNGTQLECINCAACVDACNQTMKRTNQPKGLIRYSTQRSIETGEKWKFTPRIAAYSVVLIGIIVFLVFLLTKRNDFETIITRTPNTTYQLQDSNKISNLYNVSVQNKTLSDEKLSIRLINHKGDIKLATGKKYFSVKATEETEFIVIIYLYKNQLNKKKEKIEVGIFKNNKLVDKVNVTFLTDKAYKF